MTVDPKIESSERACVHDTEPICLTGFKRQGRVLVEANMRGDGGMVRPGYWA
jgi:hypothetical protein